MGQFSKHGVGVSSYITNLSDKQASNKNQKKERKKNKGPLSGPQNRGGGGGGEAFDVPCLPNRGGGGTSPRPPLGFPPIIYRHSLPFCLASLALSGAGAAAGAGALGAPVGVLGLSLVAAVGVSFLAGVLDLGRDPWLGRVGVGLVTPAEGVRAFLIGGGLLLVDLLPREGRDENILSSSYKPLI